MTPSDRLLTIWTYATGFGLSLLTMLSAVLGWPLVVQYALVALLIGVPLGTQRVARRTHRRPRR
ncbi:MAG TPA: hypothetical protein VN635_09695 [Conexibacter sp.]|nr:hypothetical protein [Conexibacter sp.]